MKEVVARLRPDVGVLVGFAEGGKPEYPEKTPRSQTSLSQSAEPGNRSWVVEGTSMSYDSYANLTPSARPSHSTTTSVLINPAQPAFCHFSNIGIHDQHDS